MKLKSTLPLCLILWSVLAVGSTKGHTQILGASQNSSFTNISATQWAEMRQKWEEMTPAKLLKAAETGNAQAQFFYWVREWNEAYAECNRASDRMFTVAHELTSEQKKYAEARWKTADEAERRKAADAGDKGAQMVAAQLEADQAAGRGAKAFEWCKKSAGQSFPAAEYDAAVNYLGQVGWVVTEADQQKGLEFLERSADRGWPGAQFKLGMLYVVGELRPPDFSKALEYLQKAADQEGPRSQYELAQLYAGGVGEPRSDADSPVALLRKSATNDYNLALHALAERYRTGLGVPTDYIQAIRYYQAAREADEKAGPDSESQAGDVFNLVDENLLPKPDAGLNWSGFAGVLSIYLKATERADANAMSQLGEGYLAGRFLPKDPVEAYYWYSRAADQGAVNAAGKRDAIKAMLQPDQLKQAAKLHEPKP